MVEIQPRREVDFSPLRYPGGKSSLTGFFSRLIEKNFQEKPVYVEPFAGGAGAALALLLTGKVSRIVINDLDPAMWALWSAIVNNSESFQRRVRATPVTLEEWKRQRAIYQGGLARADPFDLGFATFFLNRTNRSGVLNAGVIGGQGQAGKYKVDARYNKATLLHRLARIGAMRDHIAVTNLDGLALFAKYRQSSDCFVYADPPYFDKGSFLYMNSFAVEDHRLLADELNQPTSARWVLTYDNVADIKSLYPDRRAQVFDLHYSAHKPGVASELMVFSDNLSL